MNACLDRIRHRQVRLVDPLPDHNSSGELGGVHVDDHVETRQRQIDIMAALKQLDRHHRSAVVLVNVEGYTVNEAAAILNTAPGTVKSWCARGRANLLPLLQHWDNH